MNQTKETDILAEAYTAISKLRQKAFYDVRSDDVAQFLSAIESQINLYRVAIAQKTTDDEKDELAELETRRSLRYD